MKIRKPTRRIAQASAVFIFLLAQNVGAAVSITDLGRFGGSPGVSVNNLGQVVGGSFLYSDGVIQNIGTVNAYDINNTGQATGVLDTGSKGRAFIYSNGSTQDIGSLWWNGNSQGQGINKSGQLTGYSDTTSNGVSHAFIYSSGSMIDLGTLGGTTSYGFDINATGQATGTSQTPGDHEAHAFVYSNGEMQDIGTLGGWSRGESINDAGDVTGYSWSSGSIHAFYYSNGTMLDLGNLGGFDSYGYDISNAGQVVGKVDRAYLQPSRAFMYSMDGGAINLNDLLTPDSGWNLTAAYGISDNGNYITGSGIINGEYHAFLLNLSPVPEPETYAMMLAGLGLLGAAERRRKQAKV